MSNASTTPVATHDSVAMPRPSSEQRDGEGRLISVTFESTPIQAVAPTCRIGTWTSDWSEWTPIEAVAPTGDCWLTALDGSGHSMHALDMAVRLARESGMCALDLVNVQPWLSKEAAEVELPRRGWTASMHARALLDARGLGWRLHVWMGESAARIVELADTLGSRGIVIGAGGMTAGVALLLGSVAQQVIQTARRAVLVVRAPATSEEKSP